ncbi:MAG: RNA 3'-terminal phosphate cyclase, partial [Thermoanaerobaculia bacterium]
SPGPGNVVTIEIESENVTEMFVGFGEKGLSSEAVAEKAAREALQYLAAGVPVGEHLADQLMLPMAMAGAGSFLTLPLSRHATTNAEVIQRFLPVSISAVREEGVCRVEVRSS